MGGVLRIYKINLTDYQYFIKYFNKTIDIIETIGIFVSLNKLKNK